MLKLKARMDEKSSSKTLEVSNSNWRSEKRLNQRKHSEEINRWQKLNMKRRMDEEDQEWRDYESAERVQE